MNRTTNFTRSGALTVVGQLLFVVLCFAVGRTVPLPQGAWVQPVVLLGVVLVPAVLWALFFYAQDRHEPEPSRHVFLAFGAGMAAASLFARPVQEIVLALDRWQHLSAGNLAASSFLVVGAVSAFLFYLVLRYGFYPDPEFDEPADGMVYGAFLGCGYALVESLVYLAARPSFTLFSTAYTATTNVLVYASVGALVGFFLGRAKFTPATTHVESVKAVVLGTMLLGAYHVAEEWVFLQGYQQALWVSFGLTLAVAAAVLGGATLQMRKLTAEDLHVVMDGRRGLEPLPVLLVVACLVAAGFVRHEAEAGRPFTDEAAGIQFRYAAALRTDAAQQSAPTIVPAAADIGSLTSTALLQGRTLFSATGARGRTRITVRLLEEPVDLSGFDLVPFLGGVDARRLRTEPIRVGGRTGLRIRYGYLDPAQPAEALFPAMVWVITDIVPVGGKTYVFSLQTSPVQFEVAEGQYEGVLDTATFSQR